MTRWRIFRCLVLGTALAVAALAIACDDPGTEPAPSPAPTPTTAASPAHTPTGVPVAVEPSRAPTPTSRTPPPTFDDVIENADRSIRIEYFYTPGIGEKERDLEYAQRAVAFLAELFATLPPAPIVYEMTGRIDESRSWTRFRPPVTAPFQFQDDLLQVHEVSHVFTNRLLSTDEWWFNEGISHQAENIYTDRYIPNVHSTCGERYIAPTLARLSRGENVFIEYPLQVEGCGIHSLDVHAIGGLFFLGAEDYGIDGDNFSEFLGALVSLAEGDQRIGIAEIKEAAHQVSGQDISPLLDLLEPGIVYDGLVRYQEDLERVKEFFDRHPEYATPHVSWTEDVGLLRADAEIVRTLSQYHPQLMIAVLTPPPGSTGEAGFLSDGALSGDEINALRRAQSVFGMPPFHRSFSLYTLPVNQVQALLHILTFYDPYTVVHDVTADPADPDAKGARLTRALDDFGVFPGSCVYCKGQMYATDSKEDYFRAVGPATLERTRLLNLAHHATVQADELSPCDLNDFTEAELLALGSMTSFLDSTSRISYGGPMPSLTQSVKLTEDLLEVSVRAERELGSHPMVLEHTVDVLVKPGEVLSLFTHAIAASGGPPDSRGKEECRRAVDGIVEWDLERYIHFSGHWEDSMTSIIERIFPQNLFIPAAWATFLAYESGGMDKGDRLTAQFRALNLPAAKDVFHVVLDSNAQNWIVAGGRWGVLLPAFDLYLNRNIGFGRVGLPTAALVEENKIPEHCRIDERPIRYSDGSYLARYSCALYARPLEDPPPGPFKSISLGENHVCALKEDGTAVCWGSAATGRSSPPEDERFKQISAGHDHTCALREDGTPVCWGSDFYGQSSPPDGKKFTDISAGLGYTCALDQVGTPACWGDHRLSREFLSSVFTDIDSGEISYACGVFAGGEILCSERFVPPTGTNYVSVSVSRYEACALERDGTPRCWGYDDLGGTVPSDENFTKIVAGDGWGCGLRKDGTAVCWGSITEERPTLVATLEAGEKFIDVSARSSWDTGLCMLRENGSAACWR